MLSRNRAKVANRFVEDGNDGQEFRNPTGFALRFLLAWMWCCGASLERVRRYPELLATV
jgi:hypothetical protein